MSAHSRIGFMQGRLSPLIDGKIQAFPWPYWQAEFPAAASIGIGLMEWTIDQDRIFENPIMTAAGRQEIRALSAQYHVHIPSITCDCFMQSPFWKTSGPERRELVATFERVLLSSGEAQIRYIVVPLVDNGSLANSDEAAILKETLLDFVPLMTSLNQVIAFESDFAPRRLAEFIAGWPADRFAVNFDMGNSASLGWEPAEEVPLLASRIANVHVKDRLRGGTTVPLGRGAADLPKIFSLLKAANYRGNYILQTARAVEGEHIATLARYVAFVSEQLA